MLNKKIFIQNFWRAGFANRPVYLKTQKYFSNDIKDTTHDE